MSAKVVIVDDHSMVREGLKQLLELEGEVQVIGEAGDGIECLKLLETTVPQVLLLDINMPNMNGLEVLERLKEDKVDVKIIILTVHDEIEFLLKAVDIGINGYLLKESDSSELKKAISHVIKGETYIQPSMIPLLNSKMVERNHERVKIDLLTRRELEVLKLLSVGLYNKEIGKKLDISERTVKNHISSIFKKIEVTDRTQAAVFAIRNNLINVF
ncbi:MAG: response regulator transcription factor [Lachnospiraceae bacterium]|jgi:two-component system response regulator DegU|nr:response regulator transcription factor [Lachnospiraceae bacterium]MCI8874410.1 response regulator transcription factor [Lachnospiraceae bacterium]MCI9058775.1 response regulator transcription factor [Lachnospiraceae bacterium]GFI32330.1 transcriptional regulatory protein DegU [Lachnospiraceae bacterium]